MRLITTYILLMFAIPLMGQQKLTYAKVDSLSYLQYSKGDTKGIRKTMRGAKAAGIDYYYLRMRAGITFYAKGNYEQSARHFKRALKYFPADSLANEYLYFSYAQTGRSFDAMQTSKRLLASQKQRYGIKQHPFESISISGGYAVSNNQKLNGNMQLWQPPTVYGENVMLNNFSLGQFSMVNNLSKRVKLITAYTYMNLQNTHRVQDKNIEVKADFATHQHDVYVSPVVYLGKGFYVSPALHFLQYNFTTFIRSYYPAPPVNTLDTVRKRAVYGGAEVGYRFTGWNIAAFGGVSNLFGRMYHGGLTATYYPLGNTSLYGVTSLLSLTDTTKTYFVFSQKIGVRLGKKIWAEAGLLSGKLRYFAEGNGFTIYNIPDEISLRASLNLNFYISRHVGLTVGYSYIKREGTVLHSASAADNTFSTTNYTNHLFLTGITFTP